MSQRTVHALLGVVAVCVASLVSVGPAAAEPSPPGSSPESPASPESTESLDSPVSPVSPQSPESPESPDSLDPAGTSAIESSAAAATAPPLSYLGPTLRVRERAGAPFGNRTFEVGAFDVKHNVDVVFGGLSGYFSAERDQALDDTWTWDGYKWTKQSPKTVPPARWSAVMAYVPWLGSTVMFGGKDAAGNLLADTWSWNGVDWTQRFPTTSPPARRDAAATYVGGAVHSFEMFGGVGNDNEVLKDLWRFTGTNWQLIPTTGSITGRAKGSMAYSPILDQTILFGGIALCNQTPCTDAYAGPNADDTWVLSGSSWSRKSPVNHPGRGTYGRLVYNPATSMVQLFGGRNDLVGCGSQPGNVNCFPRNSWTSIWAWTGTNWVLMSSAKTGGAGTASAVMLGPAATPEFLATGQIVVQSGGYEMMSPTGATSTYDWHPYGDRAEFDLDTIALDASTSVYVNRGTLDVGLRTVDITLDGLDGPFTVERRFATSDTAISLALPPGWTFNTGEDLRLADQPDGDKLLLGDHGSVLWFDKSGADYITPHGIDATLTTAGAGFELTYHDTGRVLTFAGNRLVSDRNAQGHAVTFAYANDRLSTITDTRGVVLTFTYSVLQGCATATCASVVSTITDSTNRTWRYDYDMDGHMSTATNPAGEQTRYEYAYGVGGRNIGSLLLSQVISPGGSPTIFLWDGELGTRTSAGVITGPTTTTWQKVARVVHGTTQRTIITDPSGNIVIADDDWWTRPYHPV